MHGITPGRQGGPTFVSDSSPTTPEAQSPHKKLEPCAEILFLSPYLQLLQIAASLKKRAPCARFPFLAASLPPPHTVWTGAAPPACIPAAPARAAEAEKIYFRFSFLFPPSLERRNKSPEVCYINLFGTHQKGKSTTVNVQKYRILGQDLLS